ncbi:DgyrCDS135 [Dimorphilus gyrociliatus]|uniref:DgyrCDS135 n=1 Tax=Dimorphilus gyrociliatus TaxID=2664684 RepID=A0A7I8V4Z5_9ANNE|nr:DgyrCDS135 [Dimorphilus gyrociliatus]
MPSKRRAKIRKNPPLPLEKEKEDENIDYGLLKTSMQMGGNPAILIARSLQSGSEEVQELLLNEINFIFECKSCKNMFRSLSNLIAHKRAFCKKNFEEPIIYEEPEEETVNIVQPEAAYEATSKVASSYVPNRKKLLSPVKCNGNNFHDSYVNSQKKRGKNLVEILSQIEQAKLNRKRSYQFSPKTTIIAKPLDANSKVIKFEVKKKECDEGSVETDDDEEDRSSNGRRERKSTKPKRICKQVDEADEIDQNEEEKEDSESGNESENKVMCEEQKEKEEGEDEEEEEEEEDATEEYKETQDENKTKRVVRKRGRKRARLTAVRPKKSGPASAKLMSKLSDFNCDPATQTCLICNKRLCNVYALLSHMINLHSLERTIYKCLFCEVLFTMESASIRHMQTKHARNVTQYTKEELKARIMATSFNVPEKEVDNLLQPRVSSCKRYAVMRRAKKRGRAIVRTGSKEKEEEVEDKNESEDEEEEKQEMPETSKQEILSMILADDDKSDAKRTSDDDQLDEMAFTEGDYEKMRSIISEKELKCLQCDRLYTNRSNLLRHAYRHLGICRYTCNLCDAMCFNKSEARTHIRRVHKKDVPEDGDIIDVHEHVKQFGTSGLDKVKKRKVSGDSIKDLPKPKLDVIEKESSNNDVVMSVSSLSLKSRDKTDETTVKVLPKPSGIRTFYVSPHSSQEEIKNAAKKLLGTSESSKIRLSETTSTSTSSKQAVMQVVHVVSSAQPVMKRPIVKAIIAKPVNTPKPQVIRFSGPTTDRVPLKTPTEVRLISSSERTTKCTPIAVSVVKKSTSQPTVVNVGKLDSEDMKIQLQVEDVKKLDRLLSDKDDK